MQLTKSGKAVLRKVSTKEKSREDKIYLNKIIKAHPLLTPEQEIEYSTKMLHHKKVFCSILSTTDIFKNTYNIWYNKYKNNTAKLSDILDTELLYTQYYGSQNINTASNNDAKTSIEKLVGIKINNYLINNDYDNLKFNNDYTSKIYNKILKNNTQNITAWPIEVCDNNLQNLKFNYNQYVKYRDIIISANYRLVLKICHYYNSETLSQMDLLQEGVMGLMKAVEKFNPTYGYRFSTYAVWWIRQSIARHITDSEKTVRLPVHLQYKLKKMIDLQNTYNMLHNVDLTPEQLSNELNLPIDIIHSMLTINAETISVNVLAPNAGDNNIVDCYNVNDYINPEDMQIHISDTKAISKVLKYLNEREQYVIKMRFGIDADHEHTLDEIGKVYNITRERVRQIETIALQKIQKLFTKNNMVF